jgi:hypothetical protein
MGAGHQALLMLSAAILGPGKGVISGGGNVSIYLATTDKYDFSNDSRTAGTSISVARDGISGASTSTIGYFVGGTNGTVQTRVDKYTFSADTVANGSNIVGTNVFSTYTATAGNNAKNVTILRTSVLDTVTSVYTYSGDTVAAGTIVSGADGLNFSCGTSTSTVGYYSGALAGNTTDRNTVYKYTFATDVVTSVAILGTACHGRASAGNTLIGVVAGGVIQSTGINQTVVDVVTYATDTRVAGTSLSIARQGAAGCGDSFTGLFAAGYNGSFLSSTEKYTYATNGVAAGTALAAVKDYGAGVCNPPSGF